MPVRCQPVAVPCRPGQVPRQIPVLERVPVAVPCRPGQVLVPAMVVDVRRHHRHGSGVPGSCSPCAPCALSSSTRLGGWALPGRPGVPHHGAGGTALRSCPCPTQPGGRCDPRSPTARRPASRRSTSCGTCWCGLRGCGDGVTGDPSLHGTSRRRAGGPVDRCPHGILSVDARYRVRSGWDEPGSRAERHL